MNSFKPVRAFIYLYKYGSTPVGFHPVYEIYIV